MALTKQDLQNIKEIMAEEITSSEIRMQSRMDSRFDKIDSRFGEVDSRFDKLEEEIKQVQMATLENFNAIQKNSKSIKYLTSKVDLINQNMISRFEVNEEKVLQVEMEIKR